MLEATVCIVKKKFWLTENYYRNLVTPINFPLLSWDTVLFSVFKLYSVSHLVNLHMLLLSLLFVIIPSILHVDFPRLPLKLWPDWLNDTSKKACFFFLEGNRKKQPDFNSIPTGTRLAWKHSYVPSGNHFKCAEIQAHL